jgi:hypothetical protein
VKKFKKRTFAPDGLSAQHREVAGVESFPSIIYYIFYILSIYFSWALAAEVREAVLLVLVRGLEHNR